MTIEDKVFAKVVAEDLEEIGKARGLTNPGDQFTVWFSTNILREDEGASVERYLIGGPGDHKIDLGVCDEEHDIITIAQCKYSGNHDTVFSTDLVDEVRNALHRARENPEAGNERRRAFVLRLRDSEKPIRLLAVAFGRFSDEAASYALKQGVTTYDFRGIKERFEYLTLPGSRPEPEIIRLRLLSKGLSAHTGSGFEMWSFLADIRDIYQGVHEHGDAFFQSNLRYRLLGGKEGRIGEEIKKTVLTRSDHLPVLNNGLTIVCKEFKLDDGAVILIQPQIVNGGQTAWAVHDACEALNQTGGLENLSGSILVKAIRTTSANLVKEITSATNTQNPITPRDMLADTALQVSIQNAFDDFGPVEAKTPILYEHKRGQFEMLQRADSHGRYRIKAKQYRRIENEFAGQLYLALLGLPQASKNQRQLIFGEESVTRTLYDYHLAAEERFKNESIGLVPRSSSLRSGSAATFAEDVMFSFGIYQLTEAYRRVFRLKLECFPPEEQQEDNIYLNLARHDFLGLWHYYSVAALQYVTESIARGSEPLRNRMRRGLIGTNANRWFARDLAAAFNLSEERKTYVILDEDIPSVEFPLFGRWVISLTAIMYEMCRKAREKPDWKSMRHYLDLRSDTFAELTEKLDEILGGPKGIKEKWFPVPA